MYNTVVLDVETTIYEDGNPFSKPNRLCCVGLLVDGEYHYFDIEHTNQPYGPALAEIKSILERASLVIAHNAKFDLNWIRRYIPTLRVEAVWDTQLFEYMWSDQVWRMPSLDESVQLAGFPGKSDDLATDYWNQGIDTTEIPPERLRLYNQGDCRATFLLYYNQVERIKTRNIQFRNLFQLHCDDLLVLQEMEFNGMKYSVSKSLQKGEQVRTEFNVAINSLKEFDPSGVVNWNSGDAVSAVLYGGSIKVRCRETVTKHYKAGDKEVERWGTKDVIFPRLIEPLARTERKKDGYYFVNEDVLRSLDPKNLKGKQLIETLLKISDLDKLMGTYYFGLPKLIDKKKWQYDLIHGTFNQCVTRTGRSSCSQPNEQNFDGRIKELFTSRF